MFILHGAHVAPDVPFRNSSFTHAEFSRPILSLLNITHDWNQSALVFGSVKWLVLLPGQYVNMVLSLETTCLLFTTCSEITLLLTKSRFKVMSALIELSHLLLYPVWPIQVCLLYMYKVLWSDGAEGSDCKVNRKGLRVSAWLVFWMLSGATEIKSCLR